MRFVMLAVLGMLGCSQASAGDGAYVDSSPRLQAGSRLSVSRKSLLGSDGSVIDGWVTTFHDDSSKEDCTAGDYFGDGVVRCLPQSVLQGYARHVGDYFADASCTEPIGSFSLSSACGGPAPTVAWVSSVTGCSASSSRRLFRTQIGTTTVYLKAGSTCTSMTVANGDQRFMRLGTEIPPSTFVSFRLEK